MAAAAAADTMRNHDELRMNARRHDAQPWWIKDDPPADTMPDEELRMNPRRHNAQPWWIRDGSLYIEDESPPHVYYTIYLYTEYV